MSMNREFSIALLDYRMVTNSWRLDGHVYSPEKTGDFVCKVSTTGPTGCAEFEFDQ